MFNKKNTPLAMDTVIGEFSSFVGNIESEGSIKILGKIEGDIRAGGDVYIESSASVIGNIYGSNAYVSGSVKGNILSKGILHLMAQARLYGDIEVTSIVTDEGAIFHGSCRMIELNKVEEASPVSHKKNRLKSKSHTLAED